LSVKRCLFLLVLVACESPLALDHTLSPIVGGQLEAGHPAVGALAQQEGEQYQGSFCTGTLIAPRWVLTAAHCVAGRGVGNSLFFMGPDARSPGEGRRPPGRFVPWQRIHVHPQYRGDALVGIFDIALVELAQAVDDVAPYPANQAPVEDFRGEDLLFVGFGVDDGVGRGGGGLKRRTQLGLAEVAPAMFVSFTMGTGTCYGDSGGPALRATEGGFTVVGVNSSIVGQGDCLGASLQTRSDTQRTWMARVMGEAPQCAANPEQVCGCAAACLPDGSCDTLLCGEALGCRMLSECLGGCGNRTGCVIRCYGDALEPARRAYEAVAGCSQTRCGDAMDFEACFNEQCGALWTTCLEDFPPGEADCATVLDCQGACRNRACQLACYAEGTLQARADFDGLVGCIQQACGALADDNAAYSACARTSCGDAWRACDPPDDCALTGGDCGEDACVLAPWGGRYCQDAGAGEAGQICDPQQVSCQDGLYCVPERRRCRPVCLGPADCPAGQACVQVEDAAEPFGTCEPLPAPDAGVGDVGVTDAAIDAEVGEPDAQVEAPDAQADSGPVVDAVPLQDAIPAIDVLQPQEDTGPDAAPVARSGGSDGGCQTHRPSAPWCLGLLGLALIRRRR
jgi:hypothetical protein